MGPIAAAVRTVADSDIDHCWARFIGDGINPLADAMSRNQWPADWADDTRMRSFVASPMDAEMREFVTLEHAAREVEL